jgi:simple sugar transport system substrate-binding protein
MNSLSLKKSVSRVMAAAVSILLVIALSSCNEKKGTGKDIGIFVPGILSDSPVYSMMVDGVQEAAAAYNKNRTENDQVSVTILEAGTNQAEWSGKLTALAATGKYAVIISSNPSLPDIADPLTKKFPSQKFILMDAYEKGNPSIATVRYNQREQAYLSGYIAALMSKTHKIGLIAAQQYPVMDTIILPGFREGAAAAVDGTSVDFRIVGNWYDASKGAELSAAMNKSGVDVILPICGGASQGVIATAKERGFYITWFDNNGFSKAPGVVIASTVMEQKKMSAEMTTRFLEDKIEWGSAQTVGVQKGFIEFVQNDPLYIQTVPKEVRSKMSAVVDDIRTGTLQLPSQ